MRIFLFIFWFTASKVNVWIFVSASQIPRPVCFHFHGKFRRLWRSKSWDKSNSWTVDNFREAKKTVSEIKPIFFNHHHHKNDFSPVQSPWSSQNLVLRKLDITVTWYKKKKKQRGWSSGYIASPYCPRFQLESCNNLCRYSNLAYFHENSCVKRQVLL